MSDHLSMLDTRAEGRYIRTLEGFLECVEDDCVRPVSDSMNVLIHDASVSVLLAVSWLRIAVRTTCHSSAKNRGMKDLRTLGSVLINPLVDGLSV